jgi:hypothetical protein
VVVVARLASKTASLGHMREVAPKRRCGASTAYLDPAHAPATGTPEIGGLSSRELLGLVRDFEGLNLVGADIVGVAPAYDHAEITGIAAAYLAYEFVSLLARG